MGEQSTAGRAGKNKEMEMEIETRLSAIEARLSALEARRPVEARASASARPAPWDLSARQPCPEARIPSTVENILGALRLQGWTRFPEEGALAKGLRYGVTEPMFAEHFARILAKYPTAAAAAQDGHHANLRIHPSMYDMLIDGRGRGYTAWSATPEEQVALFGYSQADIDALSAAHPERLITDYWDFVESGGVRGWKAREKDAFGSYL